MAQEMVAVPKEEYVKLKRQAQIDTEFLKELVESLHDIKAGRVRQVR